MKHVQLSDEFVACVATYEEMADAIRHSEAFNSEVICLVDLDHYFHAIRYIKEELLTPEEALKVGSSASIITVDDYLNYYSETIRYIKKIDIVLSSGFIFLPKQFSVLKKTTESI